MRQAPELTDAGRQDGSPTPDGDPELRRGKRRAVIAVIVSVLVVVVVIIASVMARRAANQQTANAPLPVAGVDQPGATTAACAKLDAAIPTQLAGQNRRTLANPAPPATAAWGDPAAVYRCGAATPEELNCSAHLLVVNGVNWVAIAEDDGVTFMAADRQVRIALTIPDGYRGGEAQLTFTSPAALTELSNIIAATLPARSVCDGQAQLLPVDGGG